MSVIKKAVVKCASAIKGRGAFIALAACVAAIGGAGVYAYNKTVDSLNSGISDNPPASSNEAPVNASSGGVLKDSSLSDELETITKIQPRVFPVDGEILTGFSDGELVRNETLGVWETHNGIDIAAKDGTDVRAMTNGVVLDVWEDPLWGKCVSIDHRNSVVSYYYGLGSQLSVTVGDEVDSGDVIGVAGNSASAEIALEPHIHFALKRNGEWIDPVQFVTPNAHK